MILHSKNELGFRYPLSKEYHWISVVFIISIKYYYIYHIRLFMPLINVYNMRLILILLLIYRFTFYNYSAFFWIKLYWEMWCAFLSLDVCNCTIKIIFVFVLKHF